MVGTYKIDWLVIRDSHPMPSNPKILTLISNPTQTLSLPKSDFHRLSPALLFCPEILIGNQDLTILKVKG